MIKTWNMNHIMNKNEQLVAALDYFQGLVLTCTYKTDRERKI